MRVPSEVALMFCMAAAWTKHVRKRNEAGSIYCDCGSGFIVPVSVVVAALDS